MNRDVSQAIGTGDSSENSTNESYGRGYRPRRKIQSRLQSGETISYGVTSPENYVENYYKITWKDTETQDRLQNLLATEVKVDIRRVINKVIKAKYGGTPSADYSGMTSNISTTEGV